jgi:hypothetical protein
MVSGSEGHTDKRKITREGNLRYGRERAVAAGDANRRGAPFGSLGRAGSGVVALLELVRLDPAPSRFLGQLPRRRRLVARTGVDEEEGGRDLGP